MMVSQTWNKRKETEMTEEEMAQITELIHGELHTLEDSRLKKLECYLVLLGIVLCVVCVAMGFDPWAPLPPLAAEVVRAKR